MRIKSSNLVFDSLLVALIIIVLYIGSLTITNKISLMALSICIGSLSYIKGGLKSGVIVYLATSFLGFLLLPNKLYAGIYIMFGIYPLIKLIAERYNTILEYIIKYITFNLLTIVTYFVYNSVIIINPLLENTYILILLVIAAEIAFFIFDFAFTKFIMFAQDRVFKRL